MISRKRKVSADVAFERDEKEAASDIEQKNRLELALRNTRRYADRLIAASPQAASNIVHSDDQFEDEEKRDDVDLINDDELDDYDLAAIDSIIGDLFDN